MFRLVRFMTCACRNLTRGGNGDCCEVRPVQASLPCSRRSGPPDQPAALDHDPALLIPWTKPPFKRFKEILLPASATGPRLRPIKVERCAVLLKSIARGRAWLDEVISGKASVEEIAARQKCSVRHVNVSISMAFVAPGLVTAAIEGRLPRGIGVAALRDAPAEWSRQFERLGLAQT